MYMHIPDVRGSVSAGPYKGWNTLFAYSMGARRQVRTTVGRTYNRVCSNAQGSEFMISKLLDAASPQLFGAATVGPVFPEVKIELCHTEAQFTPYFRYILKNAIVSEYQLYSETKRRPIELVAFNYTEIELRYMRQPDSPISSCLQLGSGPGKGALLCRALQNRTPAGFNLFVATVYGEMAGLPKGHGRENAWAAVGSVIINRIGIGIWRRHVSPDAIITHTGFDAYIDPLELDWSHLDFDDSYIHNHQQFLKAWAHLNKQKINSHAAMTQYEIDELKFMRQVLSSVYYKNQVTTIANYYYSPNSMPAGKLPSFLVGIEDFEQYEVPIPGVIRNDAKFYYIPAVVEQKAGAKKKGKQGVKE